MGTFFESGGLEELSAQGKKCATSLLPLIRIGAPFPPSTALP